jgi:hypothetical protein
MLYAIVVYKPNGEEVGGDLPYKGIRSWQVKGDWLILSCSRQEHILIPSEAVTSVEIGVDREAD